jgi:S-adenosylmethionine:tRNA ribosyltransferase-isomerase
MKRAFCAALLAAGLLSVGWLTARADDKKEGKVVELDGMKAAIPADWVMEKPANRLRFLQFKLPKVKDDKVDAELVITKGIGGSPKENIKRWKEQFVPPDGKSLDDVSTVSEIKIGKVKSPYLDVTGTYKFKERPFDPNSKVEMRPGQRLLGVHYEGEDDVFHIKLVGPAATVAHYSRQHRTSSPARPRAARGLFFCMTTPFFEYDLPADLIAQEPAAERDAARLMVLDRTRSTISHHIFRDLPGLLRPGDLLVRNDTRVLPARLLGRRSRTGGKWEGLFLRTDADGRWELLCQTRGRLTEGETIEVEPGPLKLLLEAKTPEGHWLARPTPAGTPAELLPRHGAVPLPPYIRKGRAGSRDLERYQTIYADRAGAVAAPTAGLHFTPSVFAALEQHGIQIASVTLHVGLGTFQPVQVADFAQHRMHSEWGELPASTAEAITACKQRGGRVVAVGTTTVRVLETVAATGPVRQWSGDTDLYIHPPYAFKAVDALLTNFHLPRSTLLLLVGAFAGDALLRRAYNEAIQQRYRFYSYGDAMLIG